MASKGGVIVVVSGEDKTGEVFNAIKKHMDETKSKAKETSDSLGQIGQTLKQGLAAAGIAIGFKELISQLHGAVTDATEFGESIAKAGERTGIAAGSLSVLHYAAAVTNTDFDKLVQTSGKMGKNLADAADGNKKLESAFQKIDITARDVVGRHDALDIVLQHLGKTLAETESPARRLQIAGDLLGKSGQAQIPVLIDLAEHFDELKKKAQDAGVYLDDMSANQLQTLNAKMKDLEQRVLGAKVAFAEGLTPALGGIIAEFSSASDNTNIWTAAGRQAGLIAIELAAVFKLTGNEVRELKDEYLNLTAALDAPYWLSRSKTDWTKDSRDQAKAKHDALVQQLHDSKADHDAIAAEEKRFHDDMKAIEDQLLHPTAASTGGGGGGTGTGGGGGRTGDSEGGYMPLEEMMRLNENRRLAFLDEARQRERQQISDNLEQIKADEQKSADALRDFVNTVDLTAGKGVTPTAQAPSVKLASWTKDDATEARGEAEKYAHGIFDPLFDLSGKWDQQWKKIKANLLRDFGQTMESQLFGSMFGDASGRGGKGMDGSGGKPKGHNGLLADGLGSLGGLLHHKSTDKTSNGGVGAGAGTVPSAATSLLQMGKKGGGAGGVQVVINNTGSPVDVGQTQVSGGGGGMDPEQMVIQIMLKQQQTNGPVYQAFTGGTQG